MSRVKPEGIVRVMAAIACALAAVVLLWPVVFTASVPAYGDNVWFWAPSTAFWTGEVKAGRFPSWDPYILGGVPFAADINHGLFYPPNWIALLAGTAGAMRLLVFFHIAFGMFGIFLFLKSIDTATPAALWGGFAFGACEAFLRLSNHVAMLESMSYIGVVLYFTVRLAEGGGLKAALLAGLALALSALAGDVHATYIIGLAAALVVTVRAIAKLAKRDVRGTGRALLAAGIAAVSAVLLAAVGILPAFELMSESTRAGAGAAYAGQHGLDATAGLATVIPNVWGAASAGTLWNFRSTNAIYVGLVVLALALYAARRPLRNAVPIAFVAAGIALSLGAASIVWHAAERFMPGFAMFRQPREYFIIAVVGFVALAARGLSEMEGATSAKERSVTWMLVLAAALLLILSAVCALFFAGSLSNLAAAGLKAKAGDAAGVAGRVVFASCWRAALVFGAAAAAFSLSRLGLLSARTSAVLISALVLTDFAVTSSRSIVFGPAELCEGRVILAGALETADAPAARIANEAPGFGEYFERFTKRQITGEMDDEARTFPVLLRVKESLVDDEPLYAGVASVLGYSTFIPERYSALYSIATGGAGSPVRLRAVPGADYRLLGANTVIESSNDWTECRPRRLSNEPGVEMVYDWTEAASYGEAKALLKAAGSRALDAPVIENPPEWARKAAASGVRHSTEDVERGTNWLSARVLTEEPGFLVVSETGFPDWSAYDNGAVIPIYHANLAFRAVYLTAGQHTVVFRFEPAMLYRGAVVTCGAIVCLLLVFLAPYMRQARK